jgi:hypothetical protein
MEEELNKMKLTVLGAGLLGLPCLAINRHFEEVVVWGTCTGFVRNLVNNKHCSKPLEVQFQKTSSNNFDNEKSY